jgi:hypothetical protein
VVSPPPRKGRALLIAGAVMMVVSILGGVIGTLLVGSGATFGDFEREVAIEGSSDRIVPGRIPFSVVDPINGGDGEMSVGIALSSTAAPEPDCSIEDSEGATIELVRSVSGESLLDQSGQYLDYTVVGTARLAVGDYEAVCAADGEPSASSGVSFTVGRVFGFSDFSDVVGPVFGIIGIWLIAGLVFIVGLVLTIVGLVQGSRSKRPPMGGGQFYGAPYPGVPQGPYPGVPQGPYPGVPQGPYPGAPQGSYPGAPAEQPPTSPPSYSPPAPPVAEPTPPEDGSVGGWTIPPSKQ